MYLSAKRSSPLIRLLLVIRLLSIDHTSVPPIQTRQTTSKTKIRPKKTVKTNQKKHCAMAVGYELLHLCKPMRNCHSITYVYRFEYSSATARKYGNAHGQSRLRHFTYIYLLMISNWFLCKPCIGTVSSMTGSIRLQTEIFMCASTSVGSSATCYRRHSGLTWRCIQSNTFQLNQGRRLSQMPSQCYIVTELSFALLWSACLQLATRFMGCTVTCRVRDANRNLCDLCEAARMMELVLSTYRKGSMIGFSVWTPLGRIITSTQKYCSKTDHVRAWCKKSS